MLDSFHLDGLHKWDLGFHAHGDVDFSKKILKLHTTPHKSSAQTMLLNLNLRMELHILGFHPYIQK